MYIYYHALVSALSTHMTHANRVDFFLLLFSSFEPIVCFDFNIVWERQKPALF